MAICKDIIFYTVTYLLKYVSILKYVRIMHSILRVFNLLLTCSLCIYFLLLLQHNDGGTVP